MNIFFVVINYSYCRAAFMNPGYVKSVPKLKFEKLVEKMDPNALCPNCETTYTSDSRHCYICDKCIGKFDHHCNWINNCVGRNNHKIFYLFILSLLIYLYLMDVLIIICFCSDFDFLAKTEYNFLGLPGPTGEGSKPGPFFKATTASIIEFEHESSYSFWFYFVLIQVMLIATLFALPLTYLVVIQTGNVFKNTTTAARFSKRKLN